MALVGGAESGVANGDPAAIGVEYAVQSIGVAWAATGTVTIGIPRTKTRIETRNDVSRICSRERIVIFLPISQVQPMSEHANYRRR